MNSAVGLWVAAEWRRRWPALLGIAVLVALAGGAATALAAGARRADSAYGRFLDSTGVPNLTAQVVLGGTKPTSADVAADRFGAHVEAIDELAALDGVESVAVESWWAISMYPEFDAPGVVTAFATGTFATAGAPATPIVIAGELPGVDEADAVVINETAVDELDLGVGSTLTFRTASPARLLEWVNNDGQFDSEAALDGPTIDVRVAAVTRTDGDLEAAFPAVVFSEGFARAHGDEIAHVETYVNLRVDPDRLDAIAADVRAIVEPYGLEVVPSTSVGAAIVPSIDVGVTTLWIAAAVAALGGLLLVAQALGRFVAAASTDEPALSAMGMTRAQRTTGPVALGDGRDRRRRPRRAPRRLGSERPVPPWRRRPGRARSRSALGRPSTRRRRVDHVRRVIGDGRPARCGGIAAPCGALVEHGPAQPPPERSAGAVARRLLRRRSGRVRPALACPSPLCRRRQHRHRRRRRPRRRHAGLVAPSTCESSPRLYGAAADLVYESNGTFGLADVIETTVATPGVTAVTSQLAINDDSLTATGPGGVAEVEPEAYDPLVGGAVVPIADGAYPQGPDQVALGSETAAALGATVGDTVTVEPDDGPPVTLTVSGVAVSWDSTDPEHAFVVQPAALQTLLCPGTSLDECNLAVNVFASVGSRGGGRRRSLPWVRHGPSARQRHPDRAGRADPVAARRLPLRVRRGRSAARRADVAAPPPARPGDRPRPRTGPSARRCRADVAGGAHGRRGTLAGVLLGAIAGPATWRAIAGGLGVIVVPRFPLLLAAAVAALGVLAAAAISAWPRWRAVHLSRRRRAAVGVNVGGAAWLWARADLRQRWTSSILLALLVAVPVGASLALVAGARRAGDSVERFVDSTELADVVVFLNGSSPLPPEVANDPRIASIERTVDRGGGAVADRDQRARLRARRRRRGVAGRTRSTGAPRRALPGARPAPTRSCSTSGAPTSTGSESAPECRSAPSPRSSPSSPSSWARPRSSASSGCRSTSSMIRPPRR